MENIEKTVVFLDSNEVIKIFHSSREDFDAILSWSGLQIRNIFDTQLANAFLGGAFSISYQDLVKQIVEVSIKKDETRSNWLKRPLRDSQLRYAASDVEYLIELYQYQYKRLKQREKFDWFKDEIEFNLKKFIAEKKDQEIKSKIKKITGKEERDLLASFNELVLDLSEKNEINPTLFFSKKNQKDFLLEILKTNLENALRGISPWKKTVNFRRIVFTFQRYLSATMIFWSLYIVSSLLVSFYLASLFKKRFMPKLFFSIYYFFNYTFFN